jgi:hypothetical protein
MKQPRLNLRLLFLISFCGVVLCLPSTLIRAAETPVSSATPAATAALVTSAPPEVPSATPAITPEPFSVRWVGKHTWKEEQRGQRDPAYAQRGENIWVDVINFKDWVNFLADKKVLPPEKHDVKDLILYLNHIALDGVSPIYAHETEWNIAPSVKTTATTVGFSLVRNDKSKPGWAHLLNQPVLNRKVIVSVGFDNGQEMPSELTPDNKLRVETEKDLQEVEKELPSITNQAEREKKERRRDELLKRLSDHDLYLTVIPKIRTAFGLIVILGALIAFLALARHTHIIRDAAAPRRPDGQRPYSLARGQMAFWFFLVIASYFFLWIVTGDMDTLNPSVLGLIGISAATALGSAFIDASKPTSAGSSGNQPIVDVTRPHLEVLAELKKLQADTQKELEALQKARTLISSSDKNALDENEREQNEVRERLANYRWQSAYFAWPTWKGVMYDLIAENNLISFHRFQIFVWTLILGIMFVANVYNELAMPEFSATLLGLLGISAGTYVGFKLPETKTS